MWCVHAANLRWCMDPYGRIEQNVITQLFQQQDAIWQVAKVTSKGQEDVQHWSRHMNFRRLKTNKERKDKKKTKTKQTHEQLHSYKIHLCVF